MSLQLYEKTFDETSAEYDDGTTTFRISHHSTGWRFDQYVNRQELSVDGLDEGTYTVEYIDGRNVQRPYSTNEGNGWPETETVIVQDVRPVVILVILADLGAEAAPRLHIKGESRDLYT